MSVKANPATSSQALGSKVSLTTAGLSVTVATITRGP